MSELAVTDAHPLIWAMLGRMRRLGRRARGLYEAADAGRAAIYVPTVVLVEVFEAEHSGSIVIDGGAESWLTALLSTGSYITVDLTREIVSEAQRLYSIPERDDRLIAATARHLGVPLITRDEEITAEASVEQIW